MKELFEAYPIMQLLPIVTYFVLLASVLITNDEVHSLFKNIFKKRIKH
jgi:hypothetical protein